MHQNLPKTLPKIKVEYSMMVWLWNPFTQNSYGHGNNYGQNTAYKRGIDRSPSSADTAANLGSLTTITPIIVEIINDEY